MILQKQSLIKIEEECHCRDDYPSKTYENDVLHRLPHCCIGTRRSNIYNISVEIIT